MRGSDGLIKWSVGEQENHRIPAVMYRLDTGFLGELDQDWLVSVIYLNVRHDWSPLQKDVRFNNSWK